MFDFFKRKPIVSDKQMQGEFIKTLMFQTLANQNIGRDFDARLAIKEGYKMAAIAYACVNKISKAVAGTKWKIVDKNTNEEIKVPALESLLYRPNPITSKNDFIEAFSMYYLVTGESYLIGTQGNSGNYSTSKPPSELYILPSQAMNVIGGKSFLPSAYEYNTGNVKQTYTVDPITGKSQVMQLKTIDPDNSYRGMSPLKAAALNIDIYNKGNAWNLALLQNGGRPSGAIQYKSQENGKLTEDQYNRLKDQIDTEISGASNAGKPLLLEGGLEWIELALNPKNMEYKESMLSAARQIASVYNVPPQLVNIPGESTYSNYEQATLSFWIETVIPMTNDIIDALNWWLTPAYGDNVKIVLDMDAISALDEIRAKKFERIQQSDFMTINEKRKAMGLEEVDGGDVVFVDASKVPIDFASDMNSDDEFTKALKEITHETK